MINKTLQSYFIGASEALLEHTSQFAINHPGFESVDSLILAEVTLNGEKQFGSLDSGDKKQALDLCRRFIELYEHEQ